MSNVEPRQKSWFGRNWLWVIPVGCLLPILAVVGCMVVGFFTIENFLKSSEVYVRSSNAVMSDPKVRAALGEPIKPSMLVNGNINTSTNGGHADILYDVTGPKGSASVHAVGDKENGKWVMKTNHVIIKSPHEEFDVPVDP